MAFLMNRRGVNGGTRTLGIGGFSGGSGFGGFKLTRMAAGRDSHGCGKRLASNGKNLPQVQVRREIGVRAKTERTPDVCMKLEYEARTRAAKSQFWRVGRFRISDCGISDSPAACPPLVLSRHASRYPLACPYLRSSRRSGLRKKDP
jgi:hypothetical protein